MNLNQFSQQIKATRWRTAKLNQYAREGLLQEQELLLRAFEELYAALDALQVAEELLRQQNKRFAAIYGLGKRDRSHVPPEFTPDPYLITDFNGTIREANSAVAKLLNIPEIFLIGKPLVAFVILAERQVFRTRLNQLCQRDPVQEWQVKLQPRNGEPFDVALKVSIAPGQNELGTLCWLLNDTASTQVEAGITKCNIS